MTLNTLIEEARKLSREERADFIDALIGMDADAPLTPEQARDLDLRIEEYESGKAKMIPGDEAIARLRKRP